MGVPNGANIPGANENYNTSRGNGGGWWGGVKDIFSGVKATITSTGGGSITKKYGGIEFTYNWGTGKWDATDASAASQMGIPTTMNLGTPEYQAGFKPQYALYALAGAVILYFMVKS